jgi:hypothetical protein
MNATVSQSDADESPPTDEAPAGDVSTDCKVERLRTYLREQTETQGELYFKSKFIAEDVGLSAKEIGALMVKLEDSAADLEVERWSYTSATTWRIAPS